MHIFRNVIAASLSLAWAVQANAAEVLDQSSVPNAPTFVTSTGITIFGQQSLGVAQTFTAGSTGVLGRIRAGLTNSSGAPVSATLSIYEGTHTNGFLPAPVYTRSISLPVFSEPPLGTSFDWNTLPSWDVSAGNVAVTPGKAMIFSINMASLNGSVSYLNTIGAWSSTSNPYAGGQLFMNFPNSGGFFTPIQPSSDLAFQTFVTSGVPEPATWAMMIIGFGAIGGTLRQGRRNRVTWSVSSGRS